MLHVTAQNGNQNGQSHQSDRHAAAIDSSTTYPFHQIVSARVEDEPLVSEESHRDGDEAGQETRIHISVADSGEKPVEEGKEAIAEYGVESANEQIAGELQDRLVCVWHQLEARQQFMRSFSVTRGRLSTRV